MESKSPMWTCLFCNHHFKSSKARKQHQRRSRCKEPSQAVMFDHVLSSALEPDTPPLSDIGQSGRMKEITNNDVTQVKVEEVQESDVKDITSQEAVITSDEARLSHTIGSSVSKTRGEQNTCPLDQGSTLQKELSNPTMGGNWQCIVCQKCFTTRRNLYFHDRKEHKDPTVCIICDEKFSSKVKFDTHMKKSHGPKPTPKYLCSECGKNFTRNDKYMQHLKNCGVTRQKCQNKKSQTRHKCTKCEKVYKHKRSLNAHIKKHHHIVIRVGSSFFNKVSTRTKHITRASAQRNICRICRKLFRTQHSLNAHKKRFHARTQGKTVNLNGNFIVLEESSVKHSLLQKCAFCARQFEDKKSLETHLTIDHFGEPVYQCSKCSSLFKSRQSLWHHRSRNHRGLVWRCTACDKPLQERQV